MCALRLRLAALSALLLAISLAVTVPAHAQPTPPAAETPAPEASGPQAPAAAEPPPEGAAPPAAAAPSTDVGQLRVLLTGGDNRPLTGSVVRVADRQAVVDDQGVAFLDVPDGTHTVIVAVPKSVLPEAATTDPEWRVGLSDITVTAGKLTEVVVALGSSGALANLEIRGAGAPAAAAAAATPEEEDDDGRTPGRVRGTIASAQDGKKVQGAHVYVANTTIETTSDSAGNFSLDVPAGTHRVAIIHPDFDTHTLPNVRVRGGKTVSINVSLNPPAGLDEWIVTAPRVQGSVGEVLQERRKAATVSDAVGAEDIRRSPDSTASTATRRVVGATVVGGQFLFVRGLGGRYSNVRLNGVPLPSTDPDLPGFQIDLFPSSLLSSLTITKTFTPDIPGDFAGGSLNVETQSFPDKFQLNVSFGGRYNTQATFKESPNYRGGDRDWLGYDDGTRALPGEVPNEIVQVRRGGTLTRDDLVRIAESFPNNWKLNRTKTLPSFNLGASVGDTLKFGSRKLGYLVTGGYRLNYQRYVETVRNIAEEENDDGSTRLVARDNLNREVGLEQAQIGALGTVSFDVAKGHNLKAVSVLTQTGDDNTSYTTGYSEQVGTPVRLSQFQFVQRQLFFNQLLGEHADLIGPLRLNWQFNTSTVKRDQPDSRDIAYQLRPNDTDYSYLQTPESGQHIYTELDQRDFGGGADLTLPLKPLTVKGGYLGRFSDRKFGARRFSSNYSSDTDDARYLPPEELFAPESYTNGILTFKESTRPDDGYASDEVLNAGYAMLDVPARDWLRLVGGLRLEAFHQAIDISTPYSTAEPESRGSSKDYLDVLPAASTIFQIHEQMNIRLAYGATVARPLVRELSKFLSQDFVRRRNVTGNPDLKRTYVHNIDARWEYFPSTTEVFAVSAFYKLFRNPIERVILNFAGDASFENISEATNYGAELEGRISLGRFKKKLEDLVLGANFAWIHSQVSLSDEERRLATTSKRPLAGQSPYVVNVSFGYSPQHFPVSAFIYYNVFGRRIDEVGFSGLPDSYEQPFHSLDLTAFVDLGAGFNLGASATNILGQSIVFRQGDIDVSRTYRGREFGLRLSWSYK